MPRHRLAALVLLMAAPALSACIVADVQTAAPAPVYSQASPYAPGPDATGPVAGYRPADGYCAEAVGVAQDAAAQAEATGTARDAGRASRTAGYARRDC
ncbi:MAG: hypothetical protein JWP04_557 [Belnapia sp.]|nr:hypothetical protein [Belnapia sp.]